MNLQGVTPTGYNNSEVLEGPVTAGNEDKDVSTQTPTPNPTQLEEENDLKKEKAFLITSLFSANYHAAKQNFIQLAREHPEFAEHSSYVVGKDHENKDLTIDIVALGDLGAKNVHLNVSCTHGAEILGSVFQRFYLGEKTKVSENTCVVLVHTLNPYGMNYNRMVDAEGVDLNVNCIERHQEIPTKPLYEKLHPIINEDSFSIIKKVKLKIYELVHGKTELKNDLLAGQYTYPKGISYGGNKIQPNVLCVVDWLNSHFEASSFKKSFSIIDVHTGTASRNKEGIFALNEVAEEVKKLIGNEIKVARRKEGTVISTLQETILSMNHHVDIAVKQIIRVPGDDLGPLIEENIAFHNRADWTPNCPESLKLLQVKNPQNEEWQVQGVILALNLFNNITKTFAHVNSYRSESPKSESPKSESPKSESPKSVDPDHSFYPIYEDVAPPNYLKLNESTATSDNLQETAPTPAKGATDYS